MLFVITLLVNRFPKKKSIKFNKELLSQNLLKSFSENFESHILIKVILKRKVYEKKHFSSFKLNYTDIYRQHGKRITITHEK